MSDTKLKRVKAHILPLSSRSHQLMLQLKDGVKCKRKTVTPIRSENTQPTTAAGSSLHTTEKLMRTMKKLITGVNITTLSILTRACRTLEGLRSEVVQPDSLIR